jgi:uncharacterized membrane protein
MNPFLWASCSAVLSAGAAITQKKVLFRLNALEFSFLVSVVIMAFSLALPFSVDVTSFPLSTVVILIGKSILGGVAFLLVMMSLQRNQITNALPLLGITPAVTALVALPVLGESLQGWEWAGIGLMMGGTYLLEKRPALPIREQLAATFASKNHSYVFAAVGLFALSSVFDKMLVGGLKTDPRVVLFYQHIVYCLLFGALLLVRKSSLVELKQKARGSAVLIGSVAVMTIAYRFDQLEATAGAPVALVLAIKRTSILFASLFGGKLFSEERLAMKLAGAVLIVGSGFIILRNVA